MYFQGCCPSANSLAGGLIYPIIFRQVVQKVNFAWAVRTMAFLSLSLGIISNATARNRVPAKATRGLFDPAFFHNPAILLFASACCVAFAGLYVPAYYIGIYSLSIGGSENAAFYLVAAMQAGSILGRVGPGYFADRTGPLNMFIPACLAAGTLTLCWLGIDNVAGLFVFAVLYGAAFGLALAMAAMCILSLLKGQMAKFGTTLGMCLFFSSPGVLVGGPITGAILHDGGNFAGVQTFSGCIIILAGLLAFAARLLAVGFKVQKV